MLGKTVSLLSFVREFAKALDEIEKDEGPGALITSSNDPKFFFKWFRSWLDARSREIL